MTKNTRKRYDRKKVKEFENAYLSYLLTYIKLNYRHVIVGIIASIGIWFLTQGILLGNRTIELKFVNLSKTVSKRSGYNVHDLYALYEKAVLASKEDYDAYEAGYNQHHFNQYVSDKIDPNRELPDVRNNMCKSRVYPGNLPTVSVIVCFINEAFSALIRTLHSVINRTPHNLLKEIILVDDFSDLADLKDNLVDHLSTGYFRKVILVRNSERQGLIVSRIKGSRLARGQVLLFLDSHCEVTIGWIEPLLSRIVKNKRSVSAPIIDIIDTHTMVYSSVPVLLCGFMWNLLFRWDPLPHNMQENATIQSYPIPSPTIAGGLFAIDKEYFQELGEYDPQLSIWGGENMELSFKVWQCGGQIEIVPCSRVGHIYRQKRPNAETENVTLLRNLLRVAHTWMDEYKKYFYRERPEAQDVMYGDISNQTDLRRKLGCKSFKWYLDNVYSEQILPDDPNSWVKEDKRKNRLKNTYLRHYSYQVTRIGKILHVSSGLCLWYSESDNYKLILADCQSKTSLQWTETDQHDLRPAHPSEICIQIQADHLNLMRCSYKSVQEFIWRKLNFTTQLFNPVFGKCLQPVKNEESASIHLVYCENNLDLHFAMVLERDSKSMFFH